MRKNPRNASFPTRWLRGGSRQRFPESYRCLTPNGDMDDVEQNPRNQFSWSNLMIRWTIAPRASGKAASYWARSKPKRVRVLPNQS